MDIGIIADLHAELQCRTIKTEFTDWSALKRAGFNTRAHWKYDEGRVVTVGECARAVYVERRTVTPAEWKVMKENFEARLQSLDDQPVKQRRMKAAFERMKITRLANGKLELVTKEIAVYHEDQTRPGNFRDRTKAIIEFGRVFWRSSQTSNFIKRNLNPGEYPAKWFTKDISKQSHEFDPFQFFSERTLLDHLNQRNIYGVKADARKPQRWMAADLDLHVQKGGNPAIFMRQVEAVLTDLQGNGWIVCLGKDVVDGIHIVKLLNEPKPLPDVQAEMRGILEKIAENDPELENSAVEAGMKPISQAEIYPSSTQGFRLPLGIGYTALVDKPLTLVKYHTYKGIPLYGADVAGLMTWNGKEMPLEEKLEYIRQRIPQNAGDLALKSKKAAKANTAARRKEEAVIASDINDRKLLGSMKGRYRKVLVDFYSGRMQVPKSLQIGILLGANALWAQDFQFEDRTTYLLELLQSFDPEPGFSSRMSNGEWEAIEYDIQHVVDSVERLRENPPNHQIDKSNDILRRWAAAMKQGGFVFGDRNTWDKCWEGTSPASPGKSFSADDLTDEDRIIIANRVAPVMACSANLAVEAVVKMVRLAAIKDRAGDGMSREYRRAVLVDLGINCQKNNKLAACWDVVEETGFIYQKCGHIFTGNRPGRARMYAVGPKLRLRSIRQMNVPYWLEEVLVGDVLLPLFSRGEAESRSEQVCSLNCPQTYT